MKTIIIITGMFIFFAPIIGNLIYMGMGGTSAKYLWFVAIPFAILFVAIFYFLSLLF